MASVGTELRRKSARDRREKQLALYTGALIISERNSLRYIRGL